jgi:hypothetical protein
VDPDTKWQRNFEASQKRLALKVRAIEHKGQHCVLCDYDNPIGLEFHHLNPETKDFEISSKMSWKTILPELDKCILVCSNHHKEIHAGFHPQYFIKDDDYY